MFIFIGSEGIQFQAGSWGVRLLGWRNMLQNCRIARFVLLKGLIDWVYHLISSLQDSN